MTSIDSSLELHTSWTEAAMHAVVTAGHELDAAKRTKSVTNIQRAQRHLQSAVDAARDLDVEWGQIGAALGIARGNAYQRFRKKPRHLAVGNWGRHAR